MWWIKPIRIFKKGMNNIKTIGLVLNSEKDNSLKVSKEMIKLIKEKKLDYLLEKEGAEKLNLNHKKASYEELRTKADLIILLGGDGTFLHTSLNFIGTDVPLMGINLGKIGFLTEVETNELEEALTHLVNGNYKVESRNTLKVTLLRNNKKAQKRSAVNDVVINRGADGQMLKVDMHINSEFVNSYRGDGIIVSTPTGSTAYSFSAGGPIINPQVKALLITPLNPHAVHVKPMVISDEEVIEIAVKGEKDKIYLTTDGRNSIKVIEGDIVRIESSEDELSLIKFPDRTFYTILRNKMRVGLV
ncbi:MAG: NAD(+)/NADH kinase [Halanaerobiales bacterium]|nr:NAD(+)/NADH kinase [Halanaerobiales bacterium]